MRVDLKVEELGGRNDYYLLTFKTYNQTFKVKTERSNMRELISIMDDAIGSKTDESYLVEVPMKDVSNIEVILDEEVEPTKEG